MADIIAISGSLREDSYNTALIRAAVDMAPEGTSVELASIAEIPLFNADVEKQSGPPAAVADLQEKLADADGLLISTPEYNWGPPGVLKNAFDWLSRPSDQQGRIFGDLPTALIGAGGGGGTRFAQAAWLPIFRHLGLRLWAGNSLFATRAWTLFEDGKLTDEATREQLTKVVGNFCAYCEAAPRVRA